MASKIMIIRHAEKPIPKASIAGVSEQGEQDPEELTVKGWQRAGALVRFFAPAAGRFVHPALATPDVLLASAVAKHSKSLRAQHTISPLAKFLGKPTNTSHPKGCEGALVAEALSTAGVVLIAWEHEAIPGIANQILGQSARCPQKWPDPRFDLVWVFDRQPGAGGWSFAQVPEMLLPGDQPEIIQPN